jgi:hypothetical protein
MGGAPWPGHMVHRGPAAVQTGGCWGVSVVWWPGDGDEAAVEEKLDYGSAQALGEGEKRGCGCGENRCRHPPFILVVRC